MSKAQELADEVLSDLMTIQERTSKGKWAQGTSSHHTVAKREGEEDYHIANFHHADDASFVDQAHKYMPLLIAEVRRLDRVNAELVKQNEAQKDEWLSWEAKRRELERDAARWRRLVNCSEMPFPIATVCDDPENDKLMVYGRKRLEDLVDGFDLIPSEYAALSSSGGTGS